MRAVTRQIEPEWDASDRALAEALHAFDAGVCPGCGLHHSILDDPDNNILSFEDRFCDVCAAGDRKARRHTALEHDWANRNPEPDRDAPLQAHLQAAARRRPGDGLHTYLRRLTAAEVEQARAATDGADETPKEGR